MNKITKIVFDIIFIFLIVLLSVYFLLRLLGIAEIYEVKTGSMEDGIHAGDYILIIKKNTYHIGDIVTFKKEDYYVTHRIIKKDGKKVITKGDANNTPDEEIKASSIVVKVIYHGGLLNFIIDYKYILASGLLGLYLLSLFFNTEKQKKE